MAKVVKICPLCGHHNQPLWHRCRRVVPDENGANRTCNCLLVRVAETVVGDDDTTAVVPGMTPGGGGEAVPPPFPPGPPGPPGPTPWPPPPGPVPSPGRPPVAATPARLVYGDPPRAVFGVADQAILGRGPDVDVDLSAIDPTPSVSRRHLQFLRRPTGWFVRDLNSTNGTLVNGSRCVPDRSILIRDGERLVCGEVELTFRTATP